MRSIDTLIALLLTLVAFGACGKKEERIDLARYVELDPGWGIVEMRQKVMHIQVKVRNISRLAFTNLKLVGESPGVTVKIRPAQIDRLIPGARKAFSLELTRRPGAKATRHSLEVTLQAKGLPVAAGLDLIVDLNPPKNGEWLDVGQIKLVRRPGGKSAYFLLVGFPLLLILGWLIWRTSQKRKRKHAQPRRGRKKGTPTKSKRGKK